MHMTTPIHSTSFFYESIMQYISKKWNMHLYDQTKLVSTAASLKTYPLTLIIKELVHSKSHMEITTSLWNNMVLRRTFTEDVHQKTNLNISLSLISRMSTNGIPIRHPTIFLLSIKHQYST